MRKGQKQTEEAKEKIRQAKLGKKRTEAEKEAISKAMKRKWRLRKYEPPKPDFDKEFTFLG